MSTQWQAAAMGGPPQGLRYEALAVIWPALGIRRKHRRRVFADLRVMEIAALEALHHGH